MLRTCYLFISLTFFVLIAWAAADEVDDLVAQLQDPDAFVRCYAAEQLGSLKDKRAVDPLLDLLEHPRPLNNSRTPLGGIDAPVVPAARIDQAKRAVAGGDSYCPPGLSIQANALKRHLAALRSGDRSAQEAALKALGQARDKRAVPTLVKMLQDSRINELLRSDIFEALGAIGDPRAFDVIAAYVKQDRPFSKRAAVTALGKLGDSRAAEILYQAMLDSLSVRDEAAQALQNLGGYEAVLYLNKALTGDDVFVRQQAQKTLDAMGLNHGLEPLLALLKDDDPQVRILAAQELARLNDPVVDIDLQQSMASLDDQARRAVEAVLDENKSSAPALSSVNEINVKIAAINALAQFREMKTIKPLMQQLMDAANNSDVRRAAGMALAQYQNSALLRTFEVELKSGDQDRQKATMESLGYLGSDQAVKLIEPGLSDPFLKDTAYKALALTRNPAALPHLYQAFRSPFLREQAMEAIKQINDPGSAVMVAKMLSTESMGVSEHLDILDYLAASGNPDIIPYLKEQAADAFVGEKVVDILIAQNHPAIIEPLVYALVNGSGEKARRKALDKLVAVSDPQTFDSIVQTVLAMSPEDHDISLQNRNKVRTFVQLALNNQLPEALQRLATKEKVEQAAQLLPIAELQITVAGILKQYNWQPTTTEQKIYFYVATEDWAACRQIGQPVIPYLLDKLAVSGSGPLASVLAQMNCDDAKSVLLEKAARWNISVDQLKVLQDEFNWRPVTMQDKLSVAASTGDRDQILKLWNQDSAVRQIIVNKLNNGDDMSMQNVMLFCIRLGKDDLLSEMINRFTRINDDFYAIRVANLFLGSGNERLVQAARSWADKKGYSVVESFAGSRTSWGQD